MGEKVRLLHTADWHLGRRLRDFPLLAEQAAVVDQVVAVAVEQAVDAVVVAGDVFDNAVPSIEALQVWSSALDRLVSADVQVFVIPGNHDQADRLAHLGGVLSRAGVHLRGSLADSEKPLVLGGVALYGLPFARPARVRAHLGATAEELPDLDDAAALRRLARIVLDAHERDHAGLTPVLVAHAFVAGAGPEDDGEDALAVGGAGAVPVDAFDGFAYVALGHIHGRRSLAGGRVRYSGSLYPTSFSEAGHAKSVSLVTVAGGAVSVDEHQLELPRRLRVIEDVSFDELLRRAAAESQAEREDFVLAQVTDVEPIEAAMSRLRAYYPRSLLEQRVDQSGGGVFVGDGDPSTLDPRKVLLAFIRDRTGQDASDAQLSVIDAAFAFGQEDGA